MYNEIGPKRSYKFYIYILVAVLSFAIGWEASRLGFFTTNVVKIDNKSAVSTDQSMLEKDGVDMGLFWKIWGELANKYVDESILKNEDMVYGAIKGMVSALEDPYTDFMTPQETVQFNESLEGTLEGIGAELTVKDKKLTIVSPLRKSPAERAGLLSGDIIYKIEGKPTDDMGVAEAITKIRGKKGTTVTLTIIRAKLEKPFDVTIVRDSIDIKSVTEEKLDNGIVYLGVNQFNEKTNEEFSKYIADLIINEPKGLIIDLRYNGGGYLDIAVQLLSYLLPKDTPAVIIKERGKKDDTRLTNGNPKLLNVPLVVIVNDSSASASEIMAGAIQDQKRGVILGIKTFGKGSVQEVEKFSDGSSLKLTIAKWFTPLGRTINHEGLTPDIFVEIKEEDIKNEYDRQKEEAIKYLKNLKK
jgi:carboxyl-terminal processing protease